MNARAHYEAMAAEAANGGPAFPLVTGQRQIGPHEFEYDIAHGMTLRDYFAAKCMPMVAAQWARDNGEAWDNGFDRMAAIAYDIADAMLRAREVTP